MKIQVSRSKDRGTAKLIVSTSETESLSEIQSIIKRHLKPVVEQAKDDLGRAVKSTAVKVRAWALENLASAKKLGKRTDLFQKLVNDPYSATNQLAQHMLNMTPVQKTSEEAQVDDLLNSLKFD